MQEKILSQLISCDFDLRNITVCQTNFKHQHVVNYMGKGRSKNILHLVTEGERIYRINGKTLRVPCGSILMIPDQTEYETVSLATDTEKVSGIGICFDMVEPSGELIAVKRDVYCNFNAEALRFSQKFRLLDQLYKNPVTPLFTLKTALGQLLHSLCSSVFMEPKELLALKPALHFIRDHYAENLPVKSYAEQCAMSESNFRKKFGKCIGMSPIDYRNELRFEEARRLYAANMGMQQIAEAVGFSDAHYLAKLYRKNKGTTLKKDAEII